MKDLAEEKLFCSMQSLVLRTGRFRFLLAHPSSKSIFRRALEVPTRDLEVGKEAATYLAGLSQDVPYLRHL